MLIKSVNLGTWTWSIIAAILPPSLTSRKEKHQESEDWNALSLRVAFKALQSRMCLLLQLKTRQEWSHKSENESIDSSPLWASNNYRYTNEDIWPLLVYLLAYMWDSKDPLMHSKQEGSTLSCASQLCFPLLLMISLHHLRARPDR